MEDITKIGLVISNNQDREAVSNEKVYLKQNSNKKVSSNHRRAGSRQIEKENKIDSFSLDNDDLFYYILKVYIRKLLKIVFI